VIRQKTEKEINESSKYYL